MPAIRIWLKNPLAVFTANDLDARGGLVIEGGVISWPPGSSRQSPAIKRSMPVSMCCCRG